MLIRSTKKILSKDNQGKSANWIKKFTTLVVVRRNLEFWEPYKIWRRNLRSRHFALQIDFFWISVRLSGPKLCPFKIETFFMEKPGFMEKIPTLQTLVAKLGTPVLGAPSVTVWTIASCKVINIADPSERKNLFHSLVNNSFAESFSRLQLGKTSPHVKNCKSQFRHCTINY